MAPENENTSSKRIGKGNHDEIDQVVSVYF